MDIVIIEDEYLLAEELESKILSIDDSINVIAKLDSVSGSIDWLRENTCDLIFLDVHLSDGISFSIFESVEVDIPVIFTTAYNQYSIKAFDLNSIAYLLKPIDDDKLRAAINKFYRLNAKVGFSNLVPRDIDTPKTDPSKLLQSSQENLKSISSDFVSQSSDIESLKSANKTDDARDTEDNTSEKLLSQYKENIKELIAYIKSEERGAAGAGEPGSGKQFSGDPASYNTSGPEKFAGDDSTDRRTYRKRFMLNMGKVQKPVSVEDIAYFMADDKYLFAFTSKGEKFFCDSTLTKLEDELDPDMFFRVNRKFYVSIDSVNELIPYSKSRIKVKLLPESEEEVIISSAKAKEFKDWLISK